MTDAGAEPPTTPEPEPVTTPDRARRTWIAVAGMVVVAVLATVAVIRNGARTSPPAPPPIDAQLLPAAPVSTEPVSTEPVSTEPVSTGPDATGPVSTATVGAPAGDTVRQPTPVLVEDGAPPVLVELVGRDGSPLDVQSLFALRILVRDDGAFLEIDQTAAAVPAGVAMWVVRVDGELQLQVTARTGSVNGVGLTDDEVASGVQVTIQGIDADGAVIAESTPTTT